MSNITINTTRRVDDQFTSVDDYPTSPTTLSIQPKSIGVTLPPDFFKRIVSTSEHLETKFALSKDGLLYSKLNEDEPWTLHLVDGDVRFTDIGVGHGKIYGIGQVDSYLYEIDANDKSIKRIDNQVKLESIVDVHDNSVVAVAASNGAEIHFDGKVWSDGL